MGSGSSIEKYQGVDCEEVSQSDNRAINSFPSPSIRTTFNRLVCPESRERDDLGSFQLLARKAISSLLALPSSGAALMEILRAVLLSATFMSPPNPVCRAFGVRRMVTVKPEV